MNKTFDAGKDEVARLCQYFATNQASFLAPGVKEAQVRQNLIDPFFEALGWDVRNAGMVAPQYREVIAEDSLDVEGQQKAPDYAFRVGTLPKFYVEAKKCGVNIHTDSAPAFQLRRYGWSGKVAASILTNFEDLGVYDCTTRPKPTDKASHARILFFSFREYPDRWRELWNLFSREAIWSGAFDQFAASRRKRGTTEVDVEFLKEIESWREKLARNMALRNEQLSSDDLNAAVQRTIDRVVFLRMAEDRGLEPYEQLLKLCERSDIYARFMRDLCRKTDEKYNSGLFHFQNEPGVSDAPDRITPKLSVDDKVFKAILQSLYFAHGSPYHFGVLPVEILGTVYERFLGKVIRLTSGHQAKVEEKPEVRKAGGVYYTPSYIVEYIVQHTVGALVDGKSPAKLAGGKSASPFRVLDMACGSGSFLLGAYQCLLDHALKWYVGHKPEMQPKAIIKDPRSGGWRLTIEEKKRLLTTHLFGVDIDPQAVEVSKLSLLLKALEGENDATLSMQLKLFRDRALPNLANNIQCGNSLIGPRYFVGKLIAEPEDTKRANPFDWSARFPEAMQSGGFDCIIGNPPYIRIQTMQEWAAREVEIYKELFHAASRGNYDIYVVFLERGLQLLNAAGRLGFICPHKFFNAKYGEPIRAVVAEGRHLAAVVHFGDQQVFDGATTYTCLLFLNKSPTGECQLHKVDDLAAWRTSGAGASRRIRAEHVTASDWNFAVGSERRIVDVLVQWPVKLGDIAARIGQGIRTSSNEVFVLETVRVSGAMVTARSEILNREVQIERKPLSPFLRGREIKAYQILSSGKVVIVPYTIQNGRATLMSETAIRSRFPHLHAYLMENKAHLCAREKGRFRSGDWFQYGRPQNIELMHQPKILVPDIADRASFAFDEGGEFAFTSGYGITLRPDVTESPKYVLALLNSSLLDFYLKRISTTMRGGFFRYFTQFVTQLPIRRIDFTKAAEKATHDLVVKLVDSILALHKHRQNANSAAQENLIQRQIAATAAEIDRQVYGLYGLTAEEIAIVAGKSEPAQDTRR